MKPWEQATKRLLRTLDHSPLGGRSGLLEKGSSTEGSASPRCDIAVLSLLLWIAAERGFEPLWSERILAEARDNLLAAGVLSAAQALHSKS